MGQQLLTSTAAELCARLSADPACDRSLRSAAWQVLQFAEAVREDASRDPFYDDCLRIMVADICALASRPSIA